MTLVRQRCAEVQVAVMMMTRLPAGSLPTPVPSLSQAAWAYPLVGVVTGFVVWLIQTATLALGLPPMVAALLTVSAAAMLTGGLHHDGLADFADGMGGGRDKPHVLEIMRDSRIGSYGVIALILVMGLQVATLAAAPPDLLAWLLIAVASRFLMTAGLVALPPARTDGLGQSAVAPGAALWPGAVAVATLGVMSGPTAMAVLVAMCALALWIAHRAMKRIQGQTGDVLGAIQILSETAGLIMLSSLV